MVEYLPVVGKVVESLHSLFSEGNSQVGLIIVHVPPSLLPARWAQLARQHDDDEGIDYTQSYGQAG